MSQLNITQLLGIFHLQQIWLFWWCETNPQKLSKVGTSIPTPVTVPGCHWWCKVTAYRDASVDVTGMTRRCLRNGRFNTPHLQKKWKRQYPFTKQTNYSNKCQKMTHVRYVLLFETKIMEIKPCTLGQISSLTQQLQSLQWSIRDLLFAAKARPVTSTLAGRSCLRSAAGHMLCLSTRLWFLAKNKKLSFGIFKISK